ncbi:MAG: hypothetical protein IT462_01930 [Planctomycetes bacterium]|nr:hypothetical protein [Planctomycetota bacterium]
MSNHARWHSRTSFLTTTLMILVALGAPFYVAGGMLEHGALFLPLSIALIWIVGTPLVRLSLATGQSEQELPSGDAALAMQWLLRLCLVAGLMYMAAQAAGWFLVAAEGRMEGLAPRLRTEELSQVTAGWHGIGGLGANELVTGAELTAILMLVMVFVGLKRRLAALSWLGTPMIMLFCVLLLLAIGAAFWLDGPSGLAALAAPVRLSALGDARMWSDAAALALLAVGAQSGVISAAGKGLPARAEIGREARILLCGTAFFTALTGMAALMLLCAVCMEQGVIPQPGHAYPGILALDLVPTLAELPGLREKLFAGWPPQFVPSPVRITLVWCVMVVIACCFGAACLLLGGNWKPAYGRSRHFWLGVGGALISIGGLAASYLRGVSEWWWPLIGVLPALLSLMRLAVAKRSGGGIRVSSIAFESSGPRMQQWHFWYALNFVRPALVAVVAVAAVTHREHGLALGGLAVGFGLMWAGSLTPPPRDRRTQRLAPVAAAAAVLLMLGGTVLAQAQEVKPPTPVEQLSPLDRRFEQLMGQPAAAERALLRAEIVADLIDARPRPGSRPDLVLWHERIKQRLSAREDPKAEEIARRLAGAQLADGIAVLTLADSSVEALQLEYSAMIPQTSQAQQLIEIMVNGQPRDMGIFMERLRAIHTRLGGPRLNALIDAPDASAPHLIAALVDDMRTTWGAHAPEARRIRVALTHTLLQGRTLLRPEPAMGVTTVITLVLCAIMLALSLLMGLGTVRQE